MLNVIDGESGKPSSVSRMNLGTTKLKWGYLNSGIFIFQNLFFPSLEG
jgi:hypothetical protein